MTKILCLLSLVVLLLGADASPLSSMKLGLQRFVNKVAGSNNKKRTDGELKSGIAKLYDDVSFSYYLLRALLLFTISFHSLLAVDWHLVGRVGTFNNANKKHFTAVGT